MVLVWKSISPAVGGYVHCIFLFNQLVQSPPLILTVPDYNISVVLVGNVYPNVHDHAYTHLGHITG